MKLPSLPADRTITAKDSGKLTDAFWLFLGNVADWIRGNGGAVYGTTIQRTAKSERRYIDPANLANGTIYIETDTGLIFQLRSGRWASLGGTVITSETLTAASTTIDAPTGGSDWIVILRQDATGGRAINWGAGILAAAAAIDTTPDTISTFRFVQSGSDWVMVGQPTTGMTP